MMRILVLILAFVGCAVGCEAMAQAYQRKVITPNYFVPAKDVAPRKEILPEIVIKKPVIEKKAPEAKIEIEPEVETEGLDFPKPNGARYYTVPEQEQVEDKYYPAKIPVYQYKYDEYISDLKIIGEKGSAPVNKNLENDLAKMNSSSHFVVEDDFGKEPVKQEVRTKRVKRD